MLGIVVKGFILIKECMITQALISYPFPHRHLHTSGKGRRAPEQLYEVSQKGSPVQHPVSQRG